MINACVYQKDVERWFDGEPCDEAFVGLHVKQCPACAAYAADQAAGSTAYGWGIQAPGTVGSSGESGAKNRALFECRKRGGSNSSCIVRVWGCDP